MPKSKYHIVLATNFSLALAVAFIGKYFQWQFAPDDNN